MKSHTVYSSKGRILGHISVKSLPVNLSGDRVRFAIYNEHRIVDAVEMRLVRYRISYPAFEFEHIYLVGDPDDSFWEQDYAIKFKGEF